MSVMDAIYARQSNGKVRPDPVARTKVEELLGAAVQAPNHYNVRPWRFIVLEGNGLIRLGKAMGDAFRRKHPDAHETAIEKERAKPLRAPLILAVAVDAPTEPRVLEVENICAVAAACQNILLAATELGLASFWRTGDAVREPEVKQFLGLAADQVLIALLYLGYPASTPDKRTRPGFEDRTIWID